MDPFQHPYVIKHQCHYIKDILELLNSKLKPAKEFTRYVYNRYPERIIEALDKCQAMDMEKKELKRLLQLPIEEPTQVPHDVRLEQRQLLDVPIEETTQVPRDIRLPRYELLKRMEEQDNLRQRVLTAQENQEWDERVAHRREWYITMMQLADIDDYIEGKRDAPPMVNLEWTAKYDRTDDNIRMLMEDLKEWLEDWLHKTSSDRNYIFQYVILDETGKEQTRNIHLTPANISKLLELLDTNGIAQDEEHYDPYEGEELPIPSWALIMRFTIKKFQDVYGHDPNDKYKPKEYGKLRKKTATRGGGFFRWFASEKLPIPIIQQLIRYQIRCKHGDKSVLKDSCAVYALKLGGVSEDVLVQMRTSRLSDVRFVPVIDLRNICDEYKINVTIRCCDNQMSGHHNNEILEKVEGHDGPTIHLCYIKDHYFLEEETPFTYSNIKECMNDTEFDKHIGMVFKGGRWRIDNTKKKLTSYELIQMLWEMELFESMSLYDLMDTPQLTFKHDVQQDMELKWNAKYTFKPASELLKQGKQKEIKWTVLFADFETDTGHSSKVVNGKYSQQHKEYLVCWSNEDGSKTGYFEGEHCGEKLLDMVDDYTIIIFHNLKYDLNFIAKYFNTVEHDVARGKVVMTWEGTYLSKHIRVKDSAALIPKKLADFVKMFKLTTGPKEKMPYNYVTYDRYMNGIGHITNCGDKETIRWGKKDYDEFMESLKSADAMLSDNRWNIKQYVQFYCHQDVRILREGFNTFRQMIMADKECLGFDVLDIHSASSLAYKAIAKNVLLQNDRILATSGVVDQYIRGAIVGGRCMVRDNGLFHTTEPLVDFDAVSLYPSAMDIIDIPLGKPKAFEGPTIPKNDYYICDIVIKSVGKNRHFPSMRVDDGVKKIWTNDVVGKRFRVDKRTLEDWIEFQQIECEVIKGIYWNNGTTPILKEFIEKVFERRKSLKSECNPLQEVYKLILNSCYGKMIQKPYSSQKVIIPEDKVADFVYKNYNVIGPDDYKIDGSQRIDANGNPTGGLHVFEKRKSIRNNFSFALLGVMVLSHSKHIMNEVMCLAEDLDIPIYYQDTDSMHMAKDKLEILATEYRKKYGRELIGKNLGQFHPDFDSNILKGEIYANESYFIAKKIYLDILTDGTKSEDYHIRMKGVSKEAIMDVCNKQFGGSIRKLYEHLYNGGKITFDLTAGKPSFELTKDFRILSRSVFERVVGI